jgi:hypothetical protein
MPRCWHRDATRRRRGRKTASLPRALVVVQGASPSELRTGQEPTISLVASGSLDQLQHGRGRGKCEPNGHWGRTRLDQLTKTMWVVPARLASAALRNLARFRTESICRIMGMSKDRSPIPLPPLFGPAVALAETPMIMPLQRLKDHLRCCTRAPVGLVSSAHD